MVVVGLPPTSDVQALQKLYSVKKLKGSAGLRRGFDDQHQSCVEPSLEPQVLFVYPPEKQLPLKYKDLLSFCFPSGVEVNAVERTRSMSELNEILLGQEHLKQSDLSFVFRLQVADNSTLYGCCVLVEEVIQKPSGLISMISDGQPLHSSFNRHIFTTYRCYCILSRLPFFELHFGVLDSILTEERLERLTKQINYLNLDSSVGHSLAEMLESPIEDGEDTWQNGIVDASRSSPNNSFSGQRDNASQLELENAGDNYSKKELHRDDQNSCEETGGDTSVNGNCISKQSVDRHLPEAVLPLLRFQQGDSSESSSSFQDSPVEDRHFRSDLDETEIEDTSSSGQEIFSDHGDILEWSKANNHGSLQTICEYYRLSCPPRGSTIRFQPLDHLHPLEYNRLGEPVLHFAGSALDLSPELAEAHSQLMVEEEAAALSVWAVACLCGSLRLDHVLTLFAGVLLEKQIVVVCSNLGILSAVVLSIIPLIRPYQWQSLLMPVLPNDMVDFLDAPVPYIVGVTNKTAEVQLRLTNAILVDIDRNQVKSPSKQHLPRYRELYSALSPYHANLVGESYLGKKRRVYECNTVQVEAAKGFLQVLRTYLESLCYNLRSHTITNVQSNDDKVSLLLKESFIESFPSYDRPFMKLFVDTQLFSVHTDLLLSFFQKE
ncbi:uncharacterized protein LOC127263326 isoform X2 [Andrographis paniculata]|nr:uncharacterized protein LOC127263326 isoform X2 [Andrographis paniculata]